MVQHVAQGLAEFVAKADFMEGGELARRAGEAEHDAIAALLLLGDHGDCIANGVAAAQHWPRACWAWTAGSRPQSVLIAARAASASALAIGLPLCQTPSTR